MPIDHSSNHKKLLASIKANQQTCCIKFSSEKEKSRGAILIFQGRVLGVIYGKRGLKGKLFGEEAYSRAIKVLLHPETELIGHLLSEPLALATASLFIGQFGLTSNQTVGENAFSKCHAELTESKLPGCILVHDNEESPVLAAYMFAGKMIALHSGRDCWLPPTPQVAFQKMSHRGEVKVSSTLLKMEDRKELTKLTFVLSGVDDSKKQDRAGLRKRVKQAFSFQTNVADHSPELYHASSNLLRNRTQGLCTEQTLSARQRIAQLVLG
jgi:hypothetical protein